MTRNEFHDPLTVAVGAGPSEESTPPAAPLDLATRLAACLESTAPPDEACWQLPRSPVKLPREGPPAMSPRARRKARELRVPLQSLPIPANGRRITERDVLAAFETLQSRAEAIPADVRFPAVREELAEAERTRARAWNYSQHCIPQLTLEALQPCAPVLSAIKAAESSSLPGVSPLDFFLRSTALLLAKEKFRAFRAVIDGNNRILRGAIDISISGPQLPGDRRQVLKAADRLSFADLVKQRKTALASPVESLAESKVDSAECGLMSIAWYLGSNVISGIERVWPGESAVLAVFDAQPHPILRLDGSFEIQSAWKLALSVDQRLIDRTASAGFLQNLMQCLSQPGGLL